MYENIKEYGTRDELLRLINMLEDSNRVASERIDNLHVIVKEQAATLGQNLRDKFAMAALAGMLADPSVVEVVGAAAGAYDYADAMLEARKEKA
jgi:hypothetical protein